MNFIACIAIIFHYRAFNEINGLIISLKTKFPKTVKSESDISQEPIKVNLQYFKKVNNSLQFVHTGKMHHTGKLKVSIDNWVNRMTMTINIFISTIQSADVRLQDSHYQYLYAIQY